MRIGVFGGTFDPVHNGHVLPVEAAAMKFQLQRVLYVPARLSPHKEAAPRTRATASRCSRSPCRAGPDWSIDLEELDREPPSYTVDTLRSIAARIRRRALAADGDRHPRRIRALAGA